jgi:hypothetical protein
VPYGNQIKRSVATKNKLHPQNKKQMKHMSKFARTKNQIITNEKQYRNKIDSL